MSTAKPDVKPDVKIDVALIGAGIMSATLGALLRRLEPSWSITVIERLEAAAAESSDPWNNAGTGHAGLCELFYTPPKAVCVNEQFQITQQFWSYAVESAMLADPRSFLHPIPHVSFAVGAANIDQLRRRHAALTGNPLFARTEFICDVDEFVRRLPLMADGRDLTEAVAMNWSPDGTDVDFGSLAAQLTDYGQRNGTQVLLGYEAQTLSRNSDGSWVLGVRDRRAGANHRLTAGFVFVGAGGGALRLLQRSGIAEARGIAGFPISGRFLRCETADVVRRHRAKVYGLPAPGAPSTTAPHLDTRIVEGKPWLLFGPFAGWSPKFLRHGPRRDLPASINAGNLVSVLGVATRERRLIGYLLGQLLHTGAARISALRDFVPNASKADWHTIVGGQRVQVIRRGELDFNTLIVGAADGSIAGLLGASPGASTAVPAMLQVLSRCFPDRYHSWLPTLEEMVPSLGYRLSDEPALYEELRRWSRRVLGLDRDSTGVEAGS